jgi:transcription elongation factor GreA
MEKEPITVNGIEKLKKELDELKNIKRPKIVQAIAEARAHGDLKENAEYHAAKDEQAKIESRVNEINNLYSRANIIDVTKLEKKGTVIFGSTVSLLDLQNKQKKPTK